MSRSLLALTLSCLLVPFPGSAAQRIDVQPDETVQVRMSKTTPNRLAMDEGLRLSAVWGNKAQVQIEKDDETGQAIVQPLAHEPFSLFVTDETKNTYSLLVIPADIPGEHVVLRPARSVRQQFGEKQAMPYKERIKQAVRDLAEGRTPRGFQAQTIPKVLSPIRVETTLNLERVFSRGSEQIEQLVLANSGTNEVRLDEHDFKAHPKWGSSLLAVGIRRLVLAPGEQTRVWLVRRVRR